MSLDTPSYKMDILLLAVAKVQELNMNFVPISLQTD